MSGTGCVTGRALRVLERSCTSLGLLGLCFAGVAYVDGLVGSRNAIAAFDVRTASEPQSLGMVEGAAHDQTPSSSDTPKLTFADDPGALAVLEIERLDLKVPVFSGTDRVTLNRGAGIVEGTARPGEEGNIVISAHRDSFFRPLKDIRIGDVIALRSVDGHQPFVVQEIFVTDPLDVDVLEPTQVPTLTLITCYPFYYVGFAPDRFIVRAAPASERGAQVSDL